MRTLTAIYAFVLASMTAPVFAADPPAKAPVERGEMRDVATCNDGAKYRNDTGRHTGACSGHGGVKSWADGSPVKDHRRHSEYK